MTSHSQALTDAISTAQQYWQICMVNARKAEAIGDIANMEKELADADAKAEQIRWYRERLELFALPLTYPKIEAMEAAQ